MRPVLSVFTIILVLISWCGASVASPSVSTIEVAPLAKVAAVPAYRTVIDVLQTTPSRETILTSSSQFNLKSRNSPASARAREKSQPTLAGPANDAELRAAGFGDSAPALLRGAATQPVSGKQPSLAVSTITSLSNPSAEEPAVRRELSPQVISTPEPGSLGLLACASLLMLRRNRRMGR